LLACIGISVKQDFAPVLQYLECEADIRRGQQSRSLFRPLHQTNIAPVELITKSGTLPFFGIAEAIQVEVAQV